MVHCSDGPPPAQVVRNVAAAPTLRNAHPYRMSVTLALRRFLACVIQWHGIAHRRFSRMDVTAASTLFAWLDREVWLLTAQDGERRSGLVATFVSQASIVPELPRVLVALSRQHFT